MGVWISPIQVRSKGQQLLCWVCGKKNKTREQASTLPMVWAATLVGPGGEPTWMSTMAVLLAVGLQVL